MGETEALKGKVFEMGSPLDNSQKPSKLSAYMPAVLIRTAPN